MNVTEHAAVFKASWQKQRNLLIGKAISNAYKLGCFAFTIFMTIFLIKKYYSNEDSSVIMINSFRKPKRMKRLLLIKNTRFVLGEKISLMLRCWLLEDY